jgi:hypothetical protein
MYILTSGPYRAALRYCDGHVCSWSLHSWRSHVASLQTCFESDVVGTVIVAIVCSLENARTLSGRTLDLEAAHWQFLVGITSSRASGVRVSIAEALKFVTYSAVAAYGFNCSLAPYSNLHSAVGVIGTTALTTSRGLSWLAGQQFRR